jgi:hypothetical protein
MIKNRSAQTWVLFIRLVVTRHSGGLNISWWRADAVAAVTVPAEQRSALGFNCG